MNEQDKRNILVCGAGQGGHAIASYAAIRGNNVSLYTHTPKKMEIIKERKNKIKMSGVYNASAELHEVSTDLESSVKKNTEIFIVTDSTAHKHYANNLAGVLTDQNIILISPGIGGALEFYNQVKNINNDTNISVSETDTLVYACKVPNIGHSHIKCEKDTILYTTIPNKKEEVSDFVEDLYHQFKYVENPLMGLDDSPVFHIVGMLKNSERILNEEDFNFYIDGITPEVATYMEKMDTERCNVAKKIGIKPRTVKKWLNLAYGVEESNLFDMVQNTPPYQNTPEKPNRSPAPDTIFHRYLLEEIPLRAVPTVHIGEMFGVNMPKYKEVIDEACVLTGIDFWKTGRTLEDMGLTEKDILNWHKRY